jgi:hypothetical protein
MSLEEGLQAVETLGLPTVITVALLVIMFQLFKVFQSISKSIDRNTDALASLQHVVGHPYLDLDKAVIVYEAIIQEHCRAKLHFVKGILERNDLKNRKEQIQENVESEFRKITGKETAKLSKFRTAAGDMGEILVDLLDWDLFLKEVFDIMFNESYNAISETKKKEDVINLKIADLHSLFDKYVNTIELEIKRRGGNNQ